MSHGSRPFKGTPDAGLCVGPWIVCDMPEHPSAADLGTTRVLHPGVDGSVDYNGFFALEYFSLLLLSVADHRASRHYLQRWSRGIRLERLLRPEGAPSHHDLE
jgi:hypothetical protein